MKLKKFGFLKRYRKVKIEGLNHHNLLNKCIREKITLREYKWKNELEATTNVSDNDYERLKKAAGLSYELKPEKEGGIIPLILKIKENKIMALGAFILGALIFYQSLFIAEIQIDGNKQISEEDLRETLKREGVYEGAEKQGDYSDIKAALYEEYDKLSWISFYESGRLLKINISEAERYEEKKVKEEYPTNIVARKSAIVEEVIPLKGYAKVEKGDYVNKGAVLISGRGKTHAEGTVKARCPLQLELYLEKNKRIKIPTGKRLPGIYIKLGNLEIDTAGHMYKYKYSARYDRCIVSMKKFIPLEIKTVNINEIRIVDERVVPKDIKSVVDAAVRQYSRDNMEPGEEILNKDVLYTESENLIRASVLCEAIEYIGIDKKIK